MKIAYTLNGLIGGLTGKNSSGSTRDDQLLILKYVSNLLQKYIVPNNDVDFFVFSWHTDFREEFQKYLSPKMIALVPQINFEIPEHLRRIKAPAINGVETFTDGNINRVINHKSRWYGFRKVMRLVNSYEIIHNFKYDLVVNARLDLCWNKPFDFESLNPNKFHIPIHPDMPTYGWPHESNEMLDHVFASNSDYMKMFSRMYQLLDSYTKPGQCEQWNTISHHFLMVWHLKKLGLLTEDTIEGSFATWHELNPKIIGGSKDDSIDYDIFRYRQLSKEEVLSYE
tara:strand:+ start:803 stop:1651 length:849 start_codon:yes stop_codon:yes gene_type:complete